MNQDQRKVSNTRNIITAVVSVIALIVIGLIYLLQKNVLMHKLLGTDGQLISRAKAYLEMFYKEEMEPDRQKMLLKTLKENS